MASVGKKRFAIIGVGGYIAPKHVEAIKNTGNELVAALDPNDSVGILDRYFEDVPFFTEYERFERFVHKLKREGKGVDFISVCSPNYLHDTHVRCALSVGANAICEKPLVLSPWNIDALADEEKKNGGTVYNILQLRYLDDIIALRKKYMDHSGKPLEVSLKYITKRGPWYQVSWKGDEEKSGGVMMNIGIHFFDFLLWVFGSPTQDPKIETLTPYKAKGSLQLQRANVNWFLSVDKNDLPPNLGKSAFRSITIDGKEVEFSEGFTNLHTKVYQEILAGNGFGLYDAKPSIELVHKLRTIGKELQ